MALANKRDQLLEFLNLHEIEAKIHYPVPIYRQEAYKYLKHKKGDFKISDLHAKRIISFPCDQHLSKKQLKYIAETVNSFYK